MVLPLGYPTHIVLVNNVKKNKKKKTEKHQDKMNAIENASIDIILLILIMT